MTTRASAKLTVSTKNSNKSKTRNNDIISDIDNEINSDLLTTTF